MDATRELLTFEGLRNVGGLRYNVLLAESPFDSFLRKTSHELLPSPKSVSHTPTCPPARVGAENLSPHP